MPPWGPLVGNTDPAEALVLSNLMTLLGLEGNEAGFLVSMVIELYEKGVLTKEDTGGLELKWGNAEGHTDIAGADSSPGGRLCGHAGGGHQTCREIAWGRKPRIAAFIP